jgi:hypothetical protein
MYKIPLLLLVGTLVSCASSINIEGARQIESQEIYAVYNALLESYAIDSDLKSLSIVRNTTPGFDEECLKDASDEAQFLSAVTSFESNNRINHELLPSFNLSFPYELAEALEQVGGARTPPDGQNYEDFLKEQLAKLQKRIDEGYTQIVLSAPGISSDGSIAIVYVGLSYGGGYYALHKTGKRWSVGQSLKCGWIS